MTIKLSTVVRQNRAQVLADAIDGGATPGKLRIYDGTRPAFGVPPVPGSQDLLAELTFSSPPEASVTNGVLVFNSIAQDASADDSGTATWARIVNGDNTVIMDMDVTTTAGSGDVKLNSVDIIQGGPVSIVSASITEGNG